MTQTNKRIGQDQILIDDELSAVCAGTKAESQIFQVLSSAISEVMKNFGGALQDRRARRLITVLPSREL